MPELPDILAYIHALRPRIGGQTLTRVRVLSPFLLRTFEPPLESAAGQVVSAIGRRGKRIVLTLTSPDGPADDRLHLVLHLMLAGRLRWLAPGRRLPGRIALATFEFPTGTLVFTEAGPRKRAALHLVRGDAALGALDPGGLEPLEADLPAFAAALQRENHTLKRALTDPRILSGIGNAYSDEILHAAQLSPLALTQKLAPEEWERLFTGARVTLELWRGRLCEEARQRFPEKVTAFREGMAVHGRYGKPCPRCGAEVLRIRYADNETNYCAECQTGGRVLADRGLSRLLGADWPRTLEELEELRKR